MLQNGMPDQDFYSNSAMRPGMQPNANWQGDSMLGRGSQGAINCSNMGLDNMMKMEWSLAPSVASRLKRCHPVHNVPELSQYRLLDELYLSVSLFVPNRHSIEARGRTGHDG